MDLQKEREAFEKLPEIKRRLDMKCVHFNGTWYATNPHMGNSFATASYLNGAWMAWQAKAQAVPASINDIQSWIAVNSFSDLDVVHDNVPIVDANELAKYIDSLSLGVSVPEGYVLVPKEPNKQFKNVLSRYLDELWMGDHGCDWDYFVDAKAIKPNEIWQFMIEAQEPANES